MNILIQRKEGYGERSWLFRFADLEDGDNIETAQDENPDYFMLSYTEELI